MKNTHVIVGVHVTDRLKRAADVQRVFTENGDIIKTRLGLHAVSDQYCLPGGLVLLELVGDSARQQKLMRDLGAIEGIDVKSMVFEH